MQLKHKLTIKYGMCDVHLNPPPKKKGFGKANASKYVRRKQFIYSNYYQLSLMREGCILHHTQGNSDH
jgi:hypothetical protein